LIGKRVASDCFARAGDIPTDNRGAVGTGRHAPSNGSKSRLKSFWQKRSVMPAT